MTQTAHLPDRSILSVSGETAPSFLQGLVTNDIEQLQPGQAAYAGLLTPQGKILFEFLVVATDTHFLIECAAIDAADLLKRLTLYRLRAKIDIRLTDQSVAVEWPETDTPPAGKGVIAFRDPRHGELGYRMVGPVGALPPPNATPGDYHRHRIRLGVPDSGDLPPDQVFALDAGFEELNGVSFRKGCYVGQEVTSRMKHRSTARRRILIARIEAPLPAPGTPITAGGREIGTLASGVDGMALAMVRLDRLAEAEAKSEPLLANDKTVHLTKPGWLRV